MDDINRYFEILGLKPGASLDEVKEAYKDLVKVWHPDRFAHDPKLQKKALEKLKEINVAYKKIHDYLNNPYEEYQSANNYQKDTSNQSQSENKNYANSSEPPKEPPHNGKDFKNKRQDGGKSKDNISSKWLIFAFAALVLYLSNKLFPTSSRAVTAVRGGIAGGLGAFIGVAVASIINFLSISRKSKIIVAWIVGISGLFIVSATSVILSRYELSDPFNIKGDLSTSAVTSTPAEYVFKVNAVSYTPDDINRELESLPASAQKMFEGEEGMTKLIDELIKKELLYQEAKKKGLDKDPAYARKIADSQKLILISSLLEKEIEDKAKVSDKDVEDFYEKNKADLIDKSGKPIEFDKIKDMLAQRLTARKQKEIFDSYIEYLKKSYVIEINEEAINPLKKGFAPLQEPQVEGKK